MTISIKDAGPQEKVTKLDAARRQLHTAIRLFFAEEDLISVHTLSRASHDVLRTLLTAKGRGTSLLKDRFLNSAYVKPEHKKEFRKYLNEPSNFFKHADRDPADVLTFHRMLCPIWLMDCSMMYQVLTGKPSRECAVFVMWFSFEHPEFLAPAMTQVVNKLLSQGIVLKHVVKKDVFLTMIKNPSDFPIPGIE